MARGDKSGKKHKKLGEMGEGNTDNKISKQIKIRVVGRKVLGIQCRENELYKFLKNPILVPLLRLPQGRAPKGSKEERVAMARKCFPA